MQKVPKKITPEMLAKSGKEHGEQSALFCWAADYSPIYPRIRFMFAIPNGGLRDQITAGRLRAEGVKRGVPDILLPVTNRCYAGLFIEMKRRKTGDKRKGETSPDQDNFHVHLKSASYKVVTCYTWQEARDEILSYIAIA